MTRTNRVLFFFCAALLIWLAAVCGAAVYGRTGSSVTPDYGDVYDAVAMDATYLYEYSGEPAAVPGNVLGAVIPSPSANSAVTAKTMASLAELWSGRLVLIICFEDNLPYSAVTSEKEWQTAQCVIDVNGDAVGHIVSLGGKEDASVGSSKLLKEFMPYFSLYFSDKKAVPLVFDRGMGTKYAVSLLERLSDCNDGYRVLILSERTDGTVLEGDAAAAVQSGDNAAMKEYLSPGEYADILMMKAILRHDGAGILSVETGGQQNRFCDSAIYFGGA